MVVISNNRVAFIPIGIGMLYFSSNVMEMEIPYTDCKNEAGAMCASIINASITSGADNPVCNCLVPFEIDQVQILSWQGRRQHFAS